MAILLGVMFFGTSVLAYLYGVHPREEETVISQFARILFTGGFGWFFHHRIIHDTKNCLLALVGRETEVTAANAR